VIVVVVVVAVTGGVTEDNDGTQGTGSFGSSFFGNFLAPALRLLARPSFFGDVVAAEGLCKRWPIMSSSSSSSSSAGCGARRER
jgi:hypothetical protein